MTWDTCLSVIVLLGVVFFITVLYALGWSAKKGHWTNFDAQARSIFDATEPEGKVIDSFPTAKDNQKR